MHYESSCQRLLSRTRTEGLLSTDNSQGQSATAVNDSCRTTLCWATRIYTRHESRRDMTLRDTRRPPHHSPPILAAQPHTRDTLPTKPNGTAPPHAPNETQPKANPHGHAQANVVANARGRGAEMEANTVPPPDPHLKTRSLRYAFGKERTRTHAGRGSSTTFNESNCPSKRHK